MSSAPSATPQPPAGGPPAAPPAQGSGGKVFLWILGGCATIVVVGTLIVIGLGYFVAHKVKEAAKNPVMAAAKFMVATSPNLETVSSDENTIVVHDRKTGKNETMKIDPDKKIMVITDDQGKTVTMKLDPTNNRLVMTDDQGKTATITADTGSMEVKGPDGNLKFGGAADKAPSWVPAYPGSNPQSVFSANSNGEIGGTYSFSTNDAADKVMSYYSDALKSGGFKVSTTTSNTDGKIGGLVSGQDDSTRRTITITVGTENGTTHVGVLYGERKQS